MRIRKIKDEVIQLNEQLVNSSIAMKQVIFFMIFNGETRKQVKQKISDYKASLNTINSG
jgi:hypothetical protein